MTALGQVDELIDEAYALYRELDDHGPLWSADLEQIERWPLTSTGHTAHLRERAQAMTARILGAVDLAPLRQRVSLLTCAAGLRQLETMADVRAERTWSSPAMGLVAQLHSAVPEHALVTPSHGDRYREKLRLFPVAIDDLCGRLVEAAARGRAPLRRNVEATIATIDAVLDVAPRDDPLARQAPPTELDAGAANRFRDDLVALVREHTRPALGQLRVTLAEYSAPAGLGDDRPGLIHVPGGEAEYARLIAGLTSPGTTSKEIHEIGLAHLEQLEEEWASVGSDAFGITDPATVRRRVAELPGRATATEVKQAATQVLGRATELAPTWFNRVPAAACIVVPVEHGSIAFYRPPSDDGSLPGRTHLNVSDPSAWAAQLVVAVVHEGIPGHHFQMALAREDQSLHQLHRRMTVMACTEGWALYAERIGKEMGLYRDPIDRLGMIMLDAWRAARMVVDTGLHALGWSRDHALDVLQSWTGLRPKEAAAEIDRYISMPGQAVTYMTGRLAIESLRDSAWEQLGDQFAIATFHDIVLSQGIVSLDGLAALVNDWVTRTRSS